MARTRYSRDLKTGHEKYAREAIDRVLVDWELDNPVTFDFADGTPWRFIETGVRLRAMIDLYHLLLDSPTLTARKHYLIVRSIVEHALRLDSRIRHFGFIPGNEGQTVAAALVLAPVMFPEFKETTLASGAPGLECAADTSRYYTGSERWLLSALQYMEASLVSGGHGRCQFGFAYTNCCFCPDVTEEGWSTEYTAWYMGGTLERYGAAIQLLTINDVWSDPLLTNTSHFSLTDGPLGQQMPLRHRRMHEIFYRYAAPDDIVMSSGDTLYRSYLHMNMNGAAIYGEPSWTKRGGSPTLSTVGLTGLRVLDSLPDADAYYESFFDPVAGFVVMRSDHENTIMDDSQLIFIDGNSSALPSHSHEDIGQVTLFAYGKHMLVDPSRKVNYGVPYDDEKEEMDFHSVSLYDTYLGVDILDGRYREKSNLQANVLLGARVEDFQSGAGFDYASVATLASNNPSAEPLVTRRVLYIRGEYAVVVDHYNPNAAAPYATGDATTYWHVGHGGDYLGFMNNLNGSTTVDSVGSGSEAIRAAFFDEQGDPDLLVGSLYVLPLHPEELTESVEVTTGHEEAYFGLDAFIAGDVDTHRVSYHFTPSLTPTREQILLPQAAADQPVVPELDALDPDPTGASTTSLPVGGRGLDASGFDLALGTRRDVVLMNHDRATNTATRSFGGYEFESDAHVAYLSYDSGLNRLLVKDGSWVTSPGGPTLFSATATVADFDVHYQGSSLQIDGKPTSATITLYAPGVTSVTYNGIAHPCTPCDGSSSSVTVNLAHTATALKLVTDRVAKAAGTGALQAWIGAQFPVTVRAVDSVGFVDAGFNQVVSLSTTPTTDVELSDDAFSTVMQSPRQVSLVDGEATFWVRSSTDNSGSSISLTAGPSGGLTSDTISFEVLSENTVAWAGPSTTVYSVTTTSVSTTTTVLAPVEAYEDGFESGDFIGGSWNAVDVQIWQSNPSQNVHSGSYSTRFNDDDVLTLELPLCGYEDVEVSYWRWTKGRESNDHFIVRWWDGSQWHVLEDIAGNHSGPSDNRFIEKSFTLPASADDNPSFKLEFLTENSGDADLAYLDDVRITADFTTLGW